LDTDPSSFFSTIDVDLLISLIAVLFLLVCSAFISGSEVALFSLSQTDIEDLSDKDLNKSTIISNLLNAPKKLLATILVTNNFINIAVVILFSSLSEKLFHSISSDIFRFVLEVVVVTFMILLFGEVLPKIYASRNNLYFSKIVAMPLYTLDILLTPLTVPMRNITFYIEKKFSVKTNFSIGQLSQALELTHQSETSKEEHKILEGIVTFGNTEVRQIMSPRIDLFTLDIEERFDDVMVKIIEKGYSRIPVYKDNIDHIEGVLFVKDLIPYIDSADFEWQTLIREPFFIPENKKLDNLLKDFQSMKNHLAIVVDEYGGTSGLVSLEDILEEIVGDISDEFDDENIIYSKIDDNNYLFEGKISLKDFYRIVDVVEDDFENSKGEAETLAGFILEISRSFPKKNQEIIFRNCTFKIENLDIKRIKQIKVTLA
jgi:putative hemolysin